MRRGAEKGLKHIMRTLNLVSLTHEDIFVYCTMILVGIQDDDMSGCYPRDSDGSTTQWLGCVRTGIDWYPKRYA